MILKPFPLLLKPDAHLQRTDERPVDFVSLRNLEAFHEQYGFVASDDVIRAVSLMVSNTLHEAGANDDFIGHFSQNEFLIFTDPANVGMINERVRSRLEKALDYFYPIKDRGQGIQRKDWLVVQTATLSSADGRFISSDEVTSELVRRRK